MRPAPPPIAGVWLEKAGISPLQDDKNNKTSSLTALYQTYFSELERYVRRTFGDGPPDPDEVAQSAFAKFLSAGEAHTIRNPRAFLYASARNSVIDYKRRQKTRKSYADEILSVEGAEKNDGISPERVLIEKERFKIMRAAIGELPEQDRRILLMHRLQNRTYADIARELAVSESAIRRAVARALAHIDRIMKSEGA